MLVFLRRLGVVFLLCICIGAGPDEDIWGSFKEIVRQKLNGGWRIVSVSDGRQDINSASDGRIMHGAFRSPPFSTGSKTEVEVACVFFFFRSLRDS